jgi:hypothetical protein
MKKITLAMALLTGFAGFAQTQIDLPITWDGTAVNYTVTDFGGNASSVVVDPTNASNMVLKSDKTAGAQTWAGTTLGTPSGLATPIPFTATDLLISVAVWSPDAGIQVRLKAEDHLNNTHTVETEATTTVAGAWDTLVFNFANQAPGTAPINLTYTFDMLSIFYNFGVDGATAGLKTYYCDNVFFGGPAVSPVMVDLPITFDAMIDYELVSFGNAIDSIVVDPTDPNNMVLRQDKPAGAQTWAGTVLGDRGLVNAIPFTATDHFMNARVWSAAAGTPILMKVENVASGSISVETIATTTVAGAWETLTFDFSANQPGTPAIDYGQTYAKVVIFGDFGNAASGKTFYFDDIQFGASNIGIEESAGISDLMVTPNPTNGVLNISGNLPSNSNVVVTVTDLQGRIIYTSTQQVEGALNHILNLDSAKSGIYMVNITSDFGSVTEKVVVRK